MMSEKVRCMECRQFSFQTAGEEWSKKGFGCCIHRMRALKLNPETERDCVNFFECDHEVVEKRVRWMQEVRLAGGMV